MIWRVSWSVQLHNYIIHQFHALDWNVMHDHITPILRLHQGFLVGIQPQYTYFKSRFITWNHYLRDSIYQFLLKPVTPTVHYVGFPPCLLCHLTLCNKGTGSGTVAPIAASSGSRRFPHISRFQACYTYFWSASLYLRLLYPIPVWSILVFMASSVISSSVPPGIVSKPFPLGARKMI